MYEFNKMLFNEHFKILISKKCEYEYIFHQGRL